MVIDKLFRNQGFRTTKIKKDLMEAEMNKKLLLIGLLFIALTNKAIAQQTSFIGFNMNDITFNTLTEMLDISQQASNTRGYGNYSFFGKLGIGLLNIPLGLGSYIAGEWGDGLAITFTQICGVGLVFLGNEIYKSFSSAEFGTITFTALAGIVVMATGVGTVAMIILEGILWPYGQSLFGRPPSMRKERTRQAQNSFNMMFIPTLEGNLAGQIEFTIRY